MMKPNDWKELEMLFQAAHDELSERKLQTLKSGQNLSTVRALSLCIKNLEEMLETCAWAKKIEP